MNILLWVLQSVLALFAFAGGAYKITSFDQIASMPSTQALPRVVWTGIGVFEMACAILLIVPRALNRMPALTPIAAAALVVEGLLLSGLNARYSVELAATNPLVWTAGMAVLAAVVAHGRFSLKP